MQKEALDSSVRSFEEVYKTSYSHGLESIYRIENVDLKSVRKLGGSQETPQTVEALKPTQFILSEQLEPELDFGPHHTGYVNSFVVEEPLQILKLSRHTEKLLLEQGLKTLGDLRSTDLSKLVFIKGLGQGHVDEVKKELASYIQNKPIDRAYLIDFVSWIRSATAWIDAKKAYLVLEDFALSSLIPLTPLESLDIRKMTLEKKLELKELGLKELAHPEKVKEVFSRFQQIEDVFLVPWMESRGGVATLDEIYERLERISAEPEWAKASISFLSKTFLSKEIPFNLREEGSLYFSSKEKWGLFFDLEFRISSYLWNHNAQILFDDLYRWICRDMLAKWEAVDKELLKKVITLSSKITRKKDEEGRLLIMRRNLYIRV